jgi:hypothetical protein
MCKKLIIVLFAGAFLRSLVHAEQGLGGFLYYWPVMRDPTT